MNVNSNLQTLFTPQDVTASSIGDRIAQARREKAVRDRRDVTQRDVAAAIGLSAAAVSQWESGERAPKEQALVALAAYLGVTPAYLRYGIEPARSYGLVAEPEPVAKPAPVKKAARKRGGTK